jgi:hypothetical protein
VYQYKVEKGQAIITGYMGTGGIANIRSTLGGAPVTAIADGAFQDNWFLQVAILPSEVTSIGSEAFRNCPLLTAVAISGENVKMGNAVFDACWYVTVYGAPGSPVEAYCRENSVPFASLDEMGLLWGNPEYIWAGDLSTVTAIRTSLIDPSRQEEETAWTVAVLVQLPTETQPGQILYTAEFTKSAFTAQTRLVDALPPLNMMRVLRLPVGLTAVEAEAFRGTPCQAVILPDSCQSIGANAFAQCRELLYVQVPAGAEIAENAFDGCSAGLIIVYTE